MNPTFVQTRHRRDDPETSREAAKNAASEKCAAIRLQILEALKTSGPLTAMEISALTGVGYFDVQRRMKEVAGIHRTSAKCDGRHVWAIGA